MTAYALGELDEGERAAVEAELARSPEARRAVEQIRRIGAELRHDLGAEPAPKLSAGQRLAVAAAATRRQGRSRPGRGRPRAATAGRWRVLRLCAPLAAAAVVIGLGATWLLWRTPHGPAPAEHELAMKDTSVKSQRPNPDAKKTVPISGQARPTRAPSPYNMYFGARGKRNAPSGVSGAMSGLRPALAGQPQAGAGDGGIRSSAGEFNTEAYDHLRENPFLSVAENPLSTFSIDVDTASYANVRRMLRQGQYPPAGAVRIEEMINYFTYDYAPPKDDRPFAVHVEAAGCPWKPAHRLVRIGLKGKVIEQKDRPASNLVFLLDVSGSMRPSNKLPLLKRAMKMLVEKLGENDRVAIAVYAGASGLVLESTSCDQKETILSALERLSAGGSTNGGQGVELAYSVAVQNFITGGTNRVILCTDGDFNVGVTNQSDLVGLIEDKAKTGVFLSVLGFGMGNYKDSTLEKLADKGNGNYAYIDSIAEARKVLVEQMGATLVTIAKDVKIQVEFNPARAAAYRLIGYENRLLRKEDFNDDTKDAGEIGAGHTVTALYEVTPAGGESPARGTDPLKYQKPASPTDAAARGELLTVKLRYKAPDGDKSKLLAVPLTDKGAKFTRASKDFKFAAAVAAFGMILRDSEHKGQYSLDAVHELASVSLGTDPGGYRTEFLELVKAAKGLTGK